MTLTDEQIAIYYSIANNHMRAYNHNTADFWLCHAHLIEKLEELSNLADYEQFFNNYEAIVETFVYKYFAYDRKKDKIHFVYTDKVYKDVAKTLTNQVA